MKLSALLLLGSFGAVAAITASQNKYATPAALPPYRLPSDNFPASQATVDAYAWQEFIALNWAASSYPGAPDSTQTLSSFGQPGDLGPGVWGTYKDAGEVFGKTKPTPWQDVSARKLLAAQGVSKRLTMMSKVDRQLLLPSAIRQRLANEHGRANGDDGQESPLQATGQWLTDQQGNLIWYEVRLNQDEFNYIYQNNLYDAPTQTSYAKTAGIWLPDGRNQYGRQGAIEVKASWRIIPTAQLAKYQGRYKIVKGQVPDVKLDSAGTPHLGNYHAAYLGLVGLHILHKTPNFSQFTWATFEHVDLAPTEGEAIDPTKDYVLFNKNCPAQCGTAVPAGCQANQPPTTSLTTPVQVVRCANTIPTDAAVAGINQQFQQQIRTANAKSVFQYYRLVSTQWPQSPVPDAKLPQQVPLPVGGITPSALGNLASETYVLRDGCMSCHRDGNAVNSSFASDYSFVFSSAQNVLGAAPRPRTPARAPARRGH